MSDVGKTERITQNRVVRLFHEELGYRYLGNWTDRLNNSNIEETLVIDHLRKAGYTREQIAAAL